MVTKRGVKLLDFGLAQMQSSTPVSDVTATMAVSVEGTIAGTLQYMSPEQLQGKPADARSDIFAFGLVLYELLTGRRAFDGDNAASVISAIMTGEPPALDLGRLGAPASTGRALKQCIAKDPDERWQSASDIRRALELVELASAPAQTPRSRARFPWVWVTGAAVVGALISAAVFRSGSSNAPEQWTFRPLTFSGLAFVPSISPDGKQTAFVALAGNKQDLDLYVQLVNGGNPLRLLDAHPAGKPAWSPDGSKLAFARRDGSLYVMPALGGSPQRISSSGTATTGDLTWSPSGTYFVFTGPGQGLFVVSAEGGEARQLTRPPSGADVSPSISPDGMLAFVRRTSTFNSAVFVMPLNRDGTSGGSAKEIATGVRDITGLDWTRDGREIVFAGSAGGGNRSLWRIARGGGKPARFPAPTMSSIQPSIARQAGRMVYVNREIETKVFKMPLEGHRGETRSLIEGEGDQRDLGVAPDGSRIAFVSNRTGSNEIWIANNDGSNQTQLTFLNGPAVGSPRWSPDGKTIAFDGYAEGSSDIYLIPVEGGKPSRLTTDPANEIRPSWSHDGEWIYFGWDRGGTSEIWKIRRSGGEPVQVTHHGGYHAFETADGQWLYVQNGGTLVKMRPDGSEEALVRNDVGQDSWVIGGRRLYLVASSGELQREPFGGSVFETVYRFADVTSVRGGGTVIGVPADESYLIYRLMTRSLGTLILIENFR
jgi:Tol biopolymer transport system component